MSDDPPTGADLAGALAALCDGAATSIGVSGAAVTVGDGQGAGELVFASDEVAAGLADLELTMGAGPGVRAADERRPVLVPDVMAVGSVDRMDVAAPALRERAHELGAGAMFAFPLQLGAVRLGVLHLYRGEPGELGDTGFRQAVSLAERLTHALLGLWVTNVENEREPDPHSLSRAAVHQATGMLVVQLGIGIDEAFARLRARAFAEGASLPKVADEIVAGRLRLAEQEEGR